MIVALWIVLWTTIGLCVPSAFWAVALSRATEHALVPWALNGGLWMSAVAAVAGLFMIQSDFWMRSSAGVATNFGLAYGVGVGLMYTCVAVVGLAIVRPIRRSKGMPDSWV